VSEIIINQEVWKILFRLKSKMDYRVMLIILFRKCTAEETITSELHISMKTLQKSLKRLIELELIKRMRHKENHDVLILLNNKFYTAGECGDCKYGSASVDKKYITCGLEKIRCLNSYERLCNGIWRMMRESYEEIGTLENLRGNIGKGGQKKDNINEWGYKDFVLFYTEQFKIHFPNAIEQIETLSIRLNVKKLMKLIREKVHESKWQYVVKHYISRKMNECKELKILINPSILMDPVSIRKFLEGKGYKIVSLEYCKIHNIFCSYVENSECRLEKSNTSCDNELVERMKERYN
jgi:hypothetical protein